MSTLYLENIDCSVVSPDVKALEVWSMVSHEFSLLVKV